MDKRDAIVVYVGEAKGMGGSGLQKTFGGKAKDGSARPGADMARSNIAALLRSGRNALHDGQTVSNHQRLSARAAQQAAMQ